MKKDSTTTSRPLFIVQHNLVKGWRLWRLRWHNFRQRNPWSARILKYSLLAFAAGTLVFTALLLWVVSTTPPTSQLQRIEHQSATEIYSADGILLGRFYEENRNVINLQEIPTHVLQALVATEDERFYRHNGIDLRAWGRVLYRTLLQGDESGGGGSTISQQIAKNLFPRQPFPFLSVPLNKMREIVIAVRLENNFEKDEILGLYLNTVPFSENVYGIDVASRRFFSKKPAELTVEEGAALIGSLKANTYYNPVRFPDRTQERRDVVLGQMRKNGYLTEAAFDSLKQIRLETCYNPIVDNRDIAPYFMNFLRSELQDLLKNVKKENGEPYDIFQDGLKIYTTLDVTLQQYAQQAVVEHMTDLQKSFEQHWRGNTPWDEDDETLIRQGIRNSARYKYMKEIGATDAEIEEAFNTKRLMNIFSWEGDQTVEMTPLDSVRYHLMLLRVGLIAMEPYSGHIKAWVGGNDYRYFQYDHVLARRQVGSVFKPILYTTALLEGIAPCDQLPNRLVTYHQYDDCEWDVKTWGRPDPTPNFDERGRDEDDWTPRNSDGIYGGSYSMEGALTNSVNTVAVHLIMQTGVRPVIDVAEDMGIMSAIPEEPSIALGSADISLYEMVNAFGTLASRGQQLRPTAIRRVETADGKVLLNFENRAPGPQVIPQDTADMVRTMMESVTRYGTAARMRWRYGLPELAVAGKTGTSQNQSDGWFIGFTPNLVAGVWVGGETPIIRFRQFKLGEGAATALPIWAYFMRSVIEDPHYRGWAEAEFPELPQDIRQSMACQHRIAPPPPPVDSLLLGDSLSNSLPLPADALPSLEGRKARNVSSTEEDDEKRRGGLFNIFRKKDKDEGDGKEKGS